MSAKLGERYRSGNYGPLLVYREASLTDRFRIVGLLVTEGRWAGVRVGIPEYELGGRFPKVSESGFTLVLLCDLCMSGAGGECHTPGCALWMNSAPDIPVTPIPTSDLSEDES